MKPSTSPWVVCALYKFVTLDNFQQLRSPLLKFMQNNQVYGTLLLAHEGINGTVAASREGIDNLLSWLQKDERFRPLDYKESFSKAQPFKRCKVKLKKEIVTMGVENIDPTQVVGTYVDPKDWNDLINDPDVVLVDTRNDYEYQVGTFKNAANPETESFREFPNYIQQNLDPNKHKKVAMFCTGGIRCEKSTAYLKQQGFSEVYHLKGGILKYLEEVPEQESSWQGECFVFDDRVTVNHQLEPGTYHQCNACRMPITDEDMQQETYKKGVSCPHCFDKTTASQKARYAERERQIQLAKLRNEKHLGLEAATALIKKQREKREQKRLQSIRSQTEVAS